MRGENAISAEFHGALLNATASRMPASRLRPARQFAVCDLAVDPASVTDECRETAVGTGENAFAPNDVRKLADALRRRVPDARCNWCRYRSRRGSAPCRPVSSHRCHTAHSCACLGFAASNEIACGLAFRIIGKSSAAAHRSRAGLRSYPSTDAAAPNSPAHSPAHGSAPPPAAPPAREIPLREILEPRVTRHRQIRAVELHARCRHRR